MAKIRDYAVTIYAASTASMVCEMPEHATGDLLVAFVNKDTASAFTTPSGWTAIQTQTSAGAGGGVYGKRATSAAETVTFALSSETCIGVIIAVQDCYGSTVADAVPTSAKSGADDSTLPLAGIGLTTAYANSLLLHGLSTDSGGGFNALPPWINLFAGDTGANSLCVSYSGKEATGAVTAPNHWGGLQDDSRGFMIEVRDGSSGASISPYLPLSTTPASQITPLNGSTGVVDKGTWAAVSTPAVTPINGKTVTGEAIATTADSGINPFRGSARSAGTSSTTNLGAVSLNLTSTFNASALQGLLFGTYLNLAPRDYVDTGKAVQGGKFILAGSDASNYKAWVVGGQFSKTERSDARNNYLIELSTTDTIYGSAGTANYGALDIIMLGSAGYYGAPSVLWNELYLLGVANIAGGSETSPIGMEDVIFSVNNGCGILPLMQQAGAGVTCWIPIQFGGTEKIGISCNLNTFQYPRKADEIDYVDFHVSNNKVGFEFYGKDANDYLHFTNCVFTSPSPYYWRFNASHSASADIDFSGTSVVGATVSLQSTVTLDNMVFIGCPGFDQNGALISNTSFTDTKVTVDSLTDLEGLLKCSFSSSGTGHAIEIGGSAGTAYLDETIFSGYAATDGNTGNEAVYVNISSGEVTIYAAYPFSVRTAGASVTVIAGLVPVVVTVTTEDGTPISGASVALYAKDDTGPLPFQDIITIGVSGGLAVVSHTGHEMISGDLVKVYGAPVDMFNGVFQIEKIDADSYSYQPSTNKNKLVGTTPSTVVNTSVSYNTESIPNGLQCGNKATPSGSGYHSVWYGVTTGASLGQSVISSFLLKSGGYNVTMYYDAYGWDGNNVSVEINLATGIINSTSIGTSKDYYDQDVSIHNEGSGWYRVDIVSAIIDGISASYGNVVVIISITDSSFVGDFTANGSSYISYAAQVVANSSLFTSFSPNPAVDLTGEIRATWAAIYGSTDVNGQKMMSRVFTDSQPVTGWARKSTSSPYYKTGPISGTIDSDLGVSMTAILLSDE